MISSIRHYQQWINQFTSSRMYWLALLLLSITMLGTALFYQYVLNEWPCMLCIQVRLWFTLLLLVSFIMLVLPVAGFVRHASNLLVLVTAIGLADRSYLLLGTERGFVFRDCGFDLGLPSWFALEKWLPSVYRVETSCGYTPELILGITMAEALMVFSVIFVVVSLLVLVSGLFAGRQN